LVPSCSSGTRTSITSEPHQRSISARIRATLGTAASSSEGDAGSGCRAWSPARPARRGRGRPRPRPPPQSPRRSRRCAGPRGRSGSGGCGGRFPAPVSGPTD
jgi:hypothetical protein